MVLANRRLAKRKIVTALGQVVSFRPRAGLAKRAFVMNDSVPRLTRLAIAILTGSTLFVAGCSDSSPDKSPSAASDQTKTTDETKAELAVKKVGFNSSEQMAWIPGGTFAMGSDDEKPDERPIHDVTVGGFWMDKTEVTNKQYAEFVTETKYQTLAEQKPDPLDFPNVPPDKLVPGAVVFSPPPGNVPLNNHRAWWVWRQGADWKHPSGPEDSIEGKEDHPVVNVCWFDAEAYADWMTKRTGVKHRLPTEAEWEFAARGGLDGKKYIWGDSLMPEEKCIANFWQGRFPNQNTTEDGYRMSAPVGQFSANGYGLYDMAGNVWEWCMDWYRADFYKESPKDNPQGPATSYDPNEPNLAKRITRGGSYLCSELYCTGYRPAARMKTSPDTGLSHTGFRLVAEGQAPKN